MAVMLELFDVTTTAFARVAVIVVLTLELVET
jgi:hypothetical protein